MECHLLELLLHDGLGGGPQEVGLSLVGHALGLKKRMVYIAGVFTVVWRLSAI
jgi:hypothetical protein